jgi:hypothetical protein
LSSLQISEILAPIAVRKWRRRCDDEGHQAGLQTGFLYLSNICHHHVLLISTIAIVSSPSLRLFMTP